MDDLERAIVEQCRRARAASRVLASSGAIARDGALRDLASRLRGSSTALFEASADDVRAARAQGQSKAFLDRLALTPEGIAQMAASLEAVAALEDPIGAVERMWTRPNGLRIGLMRVPLGVVAIVYEARPNVTTEAASLCLKAGNACLLKGGSDARRSNRALVGLVADACRAAGLPADSAVLVEPPTREAVRVLLRQEDLVDLVIPRGGEGLVRTVVAESRIPVVRQYKGVCHTYVDEGADLEMARRICVNAKVQRPATCNAMESMLVHRDVARQFLGPVACELEAAGVELRGCPRSREIVPSMRPATDEDWSTEYLDLILSVRVVDGLDDALAHIATYGTQHSEAIVTRDLARADRFLREVDAACVYVNASTRFTDGYQFGLGAEVGIATGKLHSRGPMGLRDLTTHKYVILGTGQVRS